MSNVDRFLIMMLVTMIWLNTALICVAVRNIEKRIDEYTPEQQVLSLAELIPPCRVSMVRDNVEECE